MLEICTIDRSNRSGRTHLPFCTAIRRRSQSGINIHPTSSFVAILGKFFKLTYSGPARFYGAQNQWWHWPNWGNLQTYKNHTFSLNFLPFGQTFWHLLGAEN